MIPHRISSIVSHAVWKLNPPVFCADANHSLVCYTTQRVRHGNNDSFTTCKLLSYFLHLFLFFTAIFLDGMLEVVNLQYTAVSLYVFLLFIMWFCFFLWSRKVACIEEFLSENNSGIVSIHWSFSIHYCVVQGVSASCFLFEPFVTCQENAFLLCL